MTENKKRIIEEIFNRPDVRLYLKMADMRDRILSRKTRIESGKA